MIISIYVSIFTALINLVVDFLFVDILFAPTITSTKHGLHQKHQDQIEEHNPEKQALPITPISSRIDVETTRVVPSSAEEAYLLAAISVKDIVKERVLEIDQSVSKREILRQASCHLKHRYKMEKNRSILKVRGESAKVKLTSKAINIIEEQFVNLTVDIDEQRKVLKRSQQDKFDEMWG